jgi:hypothetical protein
MRFWSQPKNLHVGWALVNPQFRSNINNLEGNGKYRDNNSYTAISAADWGLLGYGCAGSHARVAEQKPLFRCFEVTALPSPFQQVTE